MDNGIEPAFPFVKEMECLNPTQRVFAGLNKRELFAAMALQGLMANLAALRREGFRDCDITKFSLFHADALLAELEKSNLKQEGGK